MLVLSMMDSARRLQFVRIRMNKNINTAQLSSTEKLTLTVSEAAEVLGIGRSAAYQGIHSGEIPSIKIGSRIIIPKVALQQKLQAAGQANSKG